MEIFYAPSHLLHDPGKALVNGQPLLTEDDPERIEVLRRAVQEAGLGPILPPEDHGREPLLAVHDRDYLEFFAHAYARGEEYYGKPGPIFPETYAVRGLRRTRHFAGQVGYYSFGTATPILEGTWEAAYWSAQCALSAAARLRSGERCAYALCRPPGHHASTDLYGGFCFLNNAAVAARFLGGRLAILDIDYHHGNGTQEIFYSDPQVLYCSLHADPDEDYPYFWGSASETGAGAGAGANCNFPLPRGAGDDLYLSTLDRALERLDAHRPERLVLSLGLDAAAGDPAGGVCLSPQAFRRIGERLASLNLPTLFVQEGGYGLDSLGENCLSFFSGFFERLD